MLRAMTDLPALRMRLLELHKAVLDAERVSHESLHGRTTSQAFLQALTQDASLNWLAPLNLAIVRLDELLDLHAADDADQAALPAHLEALRQLLALDGRSDAFASRYGALIHTRPEVAFAHGALWNVLRA
jgi:hypothetical protein